MNNKTCTHRWTSIGTLDNPNKLICSECRMTVTAEPELPAHDTINELGREGDRAMLSLILIVGIMILVAVMYLVFAPDSADGSADFGDEASPTLYRPAMPLRVPTT